MAIITTAGSSGIFVKTGTTSHTIFTTVAGANAFSIVDIVETIPGNPTRAAYTRRIGPATAVIVDNVDTGTTVAWTELSMIVT